MGDNAFTPNWTVHPGEILLDFIENHGLTNKQVAARMNVSVETVKDILAGAAITRQTAFGLALSPTTFETLGV